MVDERFMSEEGVDEVARALGRFDKRVSEIAAELGMSPSNLYRLEGNHVAIFRAMNARRKALKRERVSLTLPPEVAEYARGLGQESLREVLDDLYAERA